ncbi:biosynthetic-type acetolactate synthase large subunit [Mesoterricola silvestris]|uniref:Acetolactate synthase n=1 Tax=Mesoterricola silvestris TaxID=2927979 RepID=A0AA48GN65_9BACT|nr:biosynthetic-type acetolactate synthase large subunit [Mesoterricola silvestris]BDU74487.1 acetolactate synthase [Mesoterricola silvestris]
MEQPPQIPETASPSARVELTGAKIIWECLEREGVEVVFGYPGGTILPTYDAMVDARVRHVLARHEQGATHMADGYSRASGRTGVVIATSGPGATNLVTGLATAMMDSVPLVAITGQVSGPLLGTDAFQEVDVTGVTIPITKHNYLVRDPRDIAPALREAFALARSGRPGPVLVDITKDAQTRSAEFDWEAAAPTRHLRHVPPPVPAELLAKAVAMMRGSRRPLILAGHGITLSGAHRALVDFAEKAGIPVAATLLGLDAFPPGHPLFLGFMGMHGSPWTNLAIQEADLLIALGMRFDDRVTGDPTTFAPHARKIHVEIDATEVGKNIPVDLALLGDLKAVLDALVPQAPALETGPWLETLDGMKTLFDSPQWPRVRKGEGMSPVDVLKELQVQAPGAVMVSDVGQHQMWEAQVMRHQRPRTLLTSGGLGTMGFALPAAIGAKIACPDAEVWVVAGDGGIQMNSQELMTLAQEGLKIGIAVLNNFNLGMVRQWQTHFYGDRRSASTLTISPDFPMLARAYGLRGALARTPEEAAAAIREARESPVSTLIEFQVDPEASVYPLIPPGARIQDMIHEPPS